MLIQQLCAVPIVKTQVNMPTIVSMQGDPGVEMDATLLCLGRPQTLQRCARLHRAATRREAGDAAWEDARTAKIRLGLTRVKGSINRGIDRHGAPQRATS